MRSIWTGLAVALCVGGSALAQTPSKGVSANPNTGALIWPTAGTFATANSLLTTSAAAAGYQPLATALSQISAGTWTGASSITTLGTIATGTWQGTAISGTYLAGPHNFTSLTANAVLLGNGTSAVQASADLSYASGVLGLSTANGTAAALRLTQASQNAWTIQSPASSTDFFFRDETAGFNVGRFSSQDGRFTLGLSNRSRTAWGATAPILNVLGSTITDTNSSGGVTLAVGNAFHAPIFTASGGTVIWADIATLYIDGGATTSGDDTATNSWGLWNVGKTRFDGTTTFNEAIILGANGTDGQGRINRTAVSGLKFRGITGSSYDFVFQNAAGTDLVRNPTGTSQLTFDGTSGITIAGPVLTSASSTSRSGFRIPHGAAPTSPVDGDVWTTTSGIYVRINGATVGPLN